MNQQEATDRLAEVIASGEAAEGHNTAGMNFISHYSHKIEEAAWQVACEMCDADIEITSEADNFESVVDTWTWLCQFEVAEQMIAEADIIENEVKLALPAEVFEAHADEIPPTIWASVSEGKQTSAEKIVAEIGIR